MDHKTTVVGRKRCCSVSAEAPIQGVSSQGSSQDKLGAVAAIVVCFATRHVDRQNPFHARRTSYDAILSLLVRGATLSLFLEVFLVHTVGGLRGC
jgi:hypothetical protein